MPSVIEERKRETVDPNENQDGSEEGQNEDEGRRDLEEDDSKEVELHFVFSCLSNWREGSKDMKTDRKKSTALQYEHITLALYCMNTQSLSSIAPST